MATKKNNSKKANVEVKAAEQIATVEVNTAATVEENTATEQTATVNEKTIARELAASNSRLQAFREDRENQMAATVEENTATEQTENKTAKKSGRAPKKEKLAVAKTNASGQYIIYGLYDGDGPMLYLLDQNNKKIRINSTWGYEQLKNGVAVRVDQKAIDEMRGKKKKAENTASAK